MSETHPLDDPKFRDWMSENDIEPHFAYGINDSQWNELYAQYQDDMENV